MDDLIAFVNSRLDEWEIGANDDRSRDDGGRCEYLLGWHLEPREMRQLIDSLRVIVAAHARDRYGCQSCEYPQHCPVPVLATIWADHPDYQQEWKP